jgi:hypothetical protein
VLTAVNDKYWASDFVPLFLIYWLTVQNGGENLIDQWPIRRFKLGSGDPFVDGPLCRGVVAEINPVQSLHNVRCQLIRAIVRTVVARFLEKRELLSVLLVLQRNNVISRLA